MTVIVGNSGSKAAANVRVRLIQGSKYRSELEGLFQSLPLASGVGHLPPGDTRQYPLIVPVNLWQEPRPAPSLNFEVTYHDGRHKITDTQQIDLEGYRSSSVEGEDQLHNIASELHAIARYMEPRTLESIVRTLCPYCKSQINSSATKCPHCLEWISRKRQSWRNQVRRIRQSRTHLPTSTCMACAGPRKLW